MVLVVDYWVNAVQLQMVSIWNVAVVVHRRRRLESVQRIRHVPL